MVWRVWMGAAVFLVVPSTGTATSHPHPAPALDRGQAIYLQHCKACHGEAGDGKTFAANVLNPPPRDFTSAASQKKLTRERMIRSATEGRPGTAMMPWKSVLTPADIRAVVHYIRQELMHVRP